MKTNINDKLEANSEGNPKADSAAQPKAGTADDPKAGIDGDTKADSDAQQTGIHWTYREVLHGKSGIIMAINLCVLCAIALASFVASNVGMKSPTLIALLLKNLITFKANSLAYDMCGLLVMSIPLIVILWPIIAGVLWVYYNFRDRNVPRTDFNLAAHGLESKKVWIWSWSIVVGIFDFTALFALLQILLAEFGESLSTTATGLCTALFTIVCLVFAERRVTYVSRYMAGRRDGNIATVKAVLNGSADPLIPEDLRNEIGRAKVATVIRIGIFLTPVWAARVVHGIDLRTKVKLYSGFLNSTIHGILTAISFGIASTAAHTIGAVSGEFVAGRQKEYAKLLRAHSVGKPHVAIEVISLVFCIVLVVGSIAYVISTGDTSLVESS